MILVTGGTGLVGSHLLHYLLKNNEAANAIFRDEKSKEKTKKVFESYGSSELYNEIKWIKANLLDYFSLEDIFEGIDYVYHCAAVVAFDRKSTHQMQEVNIEGTQHLVNLSLKNKVKKFCFVSSVASLGEYSNGDCTDEEALWQHTKNTSDYSVSKYYAENEVWRAAEEGLNVVVVNPATIIGYGDWSESSTAIIKKVNDGLSYYTPGANGFVGVNDVVKAMHLLMNKDIANERYLLVAENWPFKKLLEHIADGLGKKMPTKEAPRSIANFLRRLDEIRYFVFGTKSVLTKQSVATAYNTHCYSSDKIKKELHFEFEPLDKVIKETTAFYKS